MITIENEKLRVVIGTGRGARVEQFIDKETEKDWVWKPDALKHDRESALDLSAGFDPHWAGGWEEVFPSDAPGEINGYKLYDHGEVWRRVWTHEPKDNDLSLAFHLKCETYPTLLRKRFTLHPEEAELRIDYEIKNLSENKIPFIFKLHPAIQIEPQDKFYVPDAQMEPVALGFSRILGVDKKSSFPYGETATGETVAINEVLPNDGFKREFVKIDGLKSGLCAVMNKRTGKELSFQFDNKILPYVWLFQSYGGFENHYVAMLEPTNAGHYDLAAAAETQKCGHLEPHEVITFTIKVSLRRT